MGKKNLYTVISPVDNDALRKAINETALQNGVKLRLTILYKLSWLIVEYSDTNNKTILLLAMVLKGVIFTY